MTNPHDSAYHSLLTTVLEKGRWKNNRTGVKTLGVFGEQAKFDLSQGFPLLTTKKVFFRGIAHELLWFIKGDTNIKYLVDNNVHIWDEWAYKRFNDAVANTTRHDLYECKFPKDVIISQEQFIERIKNDVKFAAQWGELGEGTYGGMWRAFPYYKLPEVDSDDAQSYDYTDAECQVDQLKKVVDKLKSSPDDRRLIVSAWHPYWVDHCALPPCHALFQFHTEELTQKERVDIVNQKAKDKTWLQATYDFVFTHYQLNFKAEDIEKNGIEAQYVLDLLGIPRRRLNCQLYQRSCDLFLGVPFNIASYALLTHMVAQTVNMAPGVFTHAYGDLHIYENHMEQVKLQLSRTSFAPPTIKLAQKDLFDFKYEDIELTNYQSHESIKAEVAV